MSTSATDAASYHLRCLGPALVRGFDGDRISFQTRKHVVLLLHLALRPGRPVSRDTLTDLFWHADEERKARHSLSQAVSLVNKALRHDAIVPDGTNRLSISEGLVWVDVTAFERHVAAGQFHEARRLWGGSLLEGLWVPRAPKLEEWIATERSRLDRTFRHVLHELVEEHRSTGDHEAMRREAELLLSMDDLDEKAMLGYLESVTLLGDRTLALRRYGEFERRIAEELDADPCGELRAWAKRSRRDDSTNPAPSQTANREAAVLPAARPLFGREREFASLWRSWEQARAGHGSFQILEGEAGIGKSALAIKLAYQVHVAGGSVCFVRCYGTERSVPFAPATTLARQLSRQPGFLGTSGTWIAELSRLLPDLRDRFPQTAEPLPADDSTRLRLCDAVLEAVTSVSYEQPLLIIIDDIQDSDEASLALLHYLGRQTRNIPTLLVCSVRTQVDQSHATSTFLGTALSGGIAKSLHIECLPDEAIERIASQIFAQRALSPTASEIASVLSTAQGNPLLAIEAAMGLHGTHSPTRGNEKASDLAFAAVATDRLGAMSDDSRLVAGALALAERPLCEYDLAVVTRLPLAELATALGQLERGNFVRHDGPTITFPHERYAPVSRAMVSEPVLRTLHLAFAEHLAKTAGGNPSAHFEVARHFQGAGWRDRAATEAMAAAKYASSMGAVSSKAEALELALDLNENNCATVGLELGRCYLLLNELSKLRTLSERIRNSTQFDADRIYLDVAAGVQSGSIPLQDALGRIKALLNTPSCFGSLADARLLLLRVADKVFEYGEVRSAARALRRSGPREYGLFATAYTYSKYYWADRALPLLASALEAAKTAGNLVVEQLCRDGLGIVLKQVGRYRDSIGQFDYSLGLARKTMNPQAEVACLHNRAVTEMCMGDYARMRDTHDEAKRVGRAFSTWALTNYRAFNEALVHLHEGDTGQALPLFERAREGCLRSGFPVLAAQCSAALGLVCQRRGDLAGLHAAATAVREARPRGDRMSMMWTDVALLAHDQALNAGQPQQSIEHLEIRVREFARRDVSYSMALHLELIYLEESLGIDAIGRRRELESMALAFGALGIARCAASRH